MRLNLILPKVEPNVFKWQDEDGYEILDGANNQCERAIGWWIKERCRSMRGYKQERSALGISRLITFAGNITWRMACV